MLKRSYALIQQHQLTRQLFRFGFIGASAATVNFLIVTALVSSFKMLPLVANIFAFLVAFQVSYYGHKTWTFEHTASHRQTISKFFIVAVISFVLNEALYAFFLHKAHLHYQVALLLVLCIVPPITFTTSKLWAFR